MNTEITINEADVAILEELCKEYRNGTINENKKALLSDKTKNIKKDIEKAEKGNYLPTPFPVNIAEVETENKIKDTNIKLSTIIYKAPFVQVNPILTHKAYKFNDGRSRVSSRLKLLVYIINKTVVNCNYIKLVREDTIKDIGIDVNAFATSLAFMCKICLLAPITNLKSYYIINHNLLYNGSKKLLANWIMKDYATRHVDVDENGKVTLDKDYLKRELGRIKSVDFNKEVNYE